MAKKDKNHVLGQLVLLSAGRSSRMGTDKAMLRDEGNKIFAIRILMDYQPLRLASASLVLHAGNIRPILRELALAETISFPIRVLINDNPEAGRLHSVMLAIHQLKKGLPALIHDTDRPLVRTKTLQRLLQASEPQLVVQPVFKGSKGHPVVLGSAVISELRKTALDSCESLRDALKPFPKKLVHVTDEGVLLNINDPETYRNTFNKSVGTCCIS